MQAPGQSDPHQRQRDSVRTIEIIEAEGDRSVMTLDRGCLSEPDAARGSGAWLAFVARLRDRRRRTEFTTDFPLSCRARPRRRNRFWSTSCATASSRGSS